ncbi:MAG: serine hydrolase domain-containing protein [Solirubrobacterales bacterium]
MKSTLFHKMSLVIAVALTALIGGSVITSSATASQATRKALVKSIDDVLAVKNSPPGISVQVTGNGRTQFFGRGKANLATAAAPKPNERFRIASVAKAFSGAVALSLVRKGKLRLGDTIGELLPGKLPKANRVTLGQVLQHTGGVPDYIKSEAFRDAFGSNPTQYFSPERIVRYVKNVKLTHRPGSKYEYSDTDNFVVGLMAEKVTGVPYGRLLRREVYNKLNLTGTSLPNVTAMPRPFIRGYDIDPGNPPINVSTAYNPSGAWASGAIVSTLPDLGRFFRGYVSGKLFGKSIKRAQRRWIAGESQPAGPGRNDAGMGLFRYSSKCGVVYGHTGSFPGYRTFAASSADGKRSIAYMVNIQVTAGSDFPNGKRISALIRKSYVQAVCHAFG